MFHWIPEWVVEEKLYNVFGAFHEKVLKSSTQFCALQYNDTPYVFIYITVKNVENVTVTRFIVEWRIMVYKYYAEA